MVLKFRFPQNPWNLFTNSRTNSFSRGTVLHGVYWPVSHVWRRICTTGRYTL